MYDGAFRSRRREAEVAELRQNVPVGSAAESATVRVQLLGGFRVELPDGRLAGPWERPSARRLFQILVLRPRRRIGRLEVADLLFPDLAPARSANAVSKALTMAKSALSPFQIVHADRDVIWIDGAIELDAEVVRRALHDGLGRPPSEARDAALVSALRDRAQLLDDELYADWATTEREALERLRTEAFVALARDRTAGHGRSSVHSVIDAWTDVIALDWSNEEAPPRSCPRTPNSEAATRSCGRTTARLPRFFSSASGRHPHSRGATRPRSDPPSPFARQARIPVPVGPASGVTSSIVRWWTL